MNVTTIITMLGIGVGSAVAEKVLNAFGKADMASMINIAGLTGLGATAVYFIVDLIAKLGALL
ncbi:hypothetical protein [Clostridium sp.]|uniref:hypothetical protein n=1 Tax=Clostridium sp. TaxID=1506 RepID=UPI002631F53B|nr:hypothetical protein [Clostridium sp.]